MNKTKRLLIVLAVLALAFVFLFPTIQWYFLTPKEDQALALGTREQIRDYAWRIARADLSELEAQAKNGTGEVLDGKLAELIPVSKKAHKELGMKLPDEWTARTFLEAYDNQADALNDIESFYRTRILKLKKLHGNAVQLGLDLSGGMSIVIRADLDALAEKTGKALSGAEREDAIERAIEVLNSRIDKFGLTEPVIRRQGDEHIYVEIPGAADPERINSIIMGSGRLAFHIVNDAASQELTNYLLNKPTGIDEAMNVLDPGIVPEGHVVRKYYIKDAYGLDEWTGRYVVVEEKAGLDGNHIKSASISSDPITAQPQVVFNLDAEGGEIFYEFTSAHTNQPLAMIMDDRVKQIANISGPINANVSISGSFSTEEANNLASVLRTAALPVELVLESQQAIGASMGEDAIAEGIKAITVGVLAVFMFMLLYYKGAGINATLAQVLNLYLMMSILSAFNLTLTLPAIAGFVLTLGMSVDANVIIFERIKEELRDKKGRKASVSAGFSKAFWAIMDSNITTIIAALFMAQLGSGPIQGFAITLAIGNMSSLFTSLFVSRLLFDFNTDVFRRDTMSISWRVK